MLNHGTLFSSFNTKHLVTGPSKFIKPRCNSGRRSFAGYSALLPSDVIDFAMLPAQRFWRGTVKKLEADTPQLYNPHHHKIIISMHNIN